MAGRVAYYGGIVRDGLVLNIDAAKKDSYPGTGTTWRDVSGNSRSGSLVSGTSFTSTNGGAINFAGGYVSGSSQVNTGQNFTVSVWTYPTLLGTTRRALVGNSYNYSSANGWFFSTAGAGTNNTFFFSVGADLAYRVAIANTLAVNQWYYLTAVCQNGGGSIDLYKNGTIITSYAVSLQTTNTVTYTTAELNIGARISTALDPYSGSIAQVQIYNRALSATEVLQNYNAVKGRFGL
jgi:hypothetical protein